MIFTGGAQPPRTPPVRTDRPLGGGGRPPSTLPLLREKTGGRAAAGEPVRSEGIPNARPDARIPQTVFFVDSISDIALGFLQKRQIRESETSKTSKIVSQSRRNLLPPGQFSYSRGDLRWRAAAPALPAPNTGSHWWLGPPVGPTKIRNLFN